ncbi:hypothetical protein GH714_000439 [Hevea brasiliensis]|uniref:Protein DEFECTIVE IN MERISTEM SILENCING 3 n=1 Tax=Hevea brasiliensis TaxID=3981 RepID=A0A6A6NFB8_HEVBR|nr:hypothetical protein GH714_000439 [Hevea brasiliensis]
MQVDQKETSIIPRDDVQNGEFLQSQSIIYASKKLQDDLHVLGLKIKQHENNVKFLKNEKNKLEDSILDLQVILGKYHSATQPNIENDRRSSNQSEEETTEQILQHEKSAAGILCQLRLHYGTCASHLTLTKDVLGIVATLGKVNDDNLSRLLSEYLGVETMLAIVCKTYEGVTALETYDKEGHINNDSGLHGLGASIGRALSGRFLVICLENLRHESLNMSFCNLEFHGYGLRETLFYNLFSRLQVYKSREDMLLALPCITDGAISLDGGMIKATGLFSLGNRNDVDVRFPKPSLAANLPDNYSETEKQLSGMKWKKDKLMEDVKREQSLLNAAKYSFERKKEEFVKFLAESSAYATQCPEAQLVYRPPSVVDMLEGRL